MCLLIVPMRTFHQSLMVGSARVASLGAFGGLVRFVDFHVGTTDWPVVLFLRAVRRIDSNFRDRHRTSVFDANAGSAGTPTHQFLVRWVR